MSKETLFRLLSKRLQWSFEKEPNEAVFQVRLRTCRILQRWVESHFETDFQADHAFTTSVSDTLSEWMNSPHLGDAEFKNTMAAILLTIDNKVALLSYSFHMFKMVYSLECRVAWSTSPTLSLLCLLNLPSQLCLARKRVA
jgi:hypothetical protein